MAAPQSTVSALIRFLNGQVGYKETGGEDGHSGNLTKYGQAYGWNGVAWCSIFVWFAFLQIAVDLRKLIVRGYASADGARQGFIKRNWYTPGLKGIRPGDIAFFHITGEHAGANHTGIVVRVDRNGVWTVEGNTSNGQTGSQREGNGVFLRLRPASLFLGFGRVPTVKYDLGTRAKTAAAKKVSKKYPTLVKGSTNRKAVAKLQKLLVKAGVHVDGQPLKVDGDFGDKTYRAVRGLQHARGLYVDGVAGPATLKSLGY